MSDVSLTLETDADVLELTNILTMRKFYGQDTFGHLSTFINDTLVECLTAVPAIAPHFEVFRTHIADRFEADCTAEAEPLWAFLEGQADDNAREAIVRAFFLPLAPFKPITFGSPQEVAHAYRA